MKRTRLWHCWVWFKVKLSIRLWRWFGIDVLGPKGVA